MVKQYLEKKYRSFDQRPKQKVFHAELIAYECNCKVDIVKLQLKEMLGLRSISHKTYFDFQTFANTTERVIHILDG